MSQSDDARHAHTAHSARHFVILGLMGVGKSTTGIALADACQRDYIDSDHDLEVVLGETGAELAQRLGIPELHRLEAAMLLGRLSGDRPAVITAAASIVEDARCREALARRAHVTVLHAPHELIIERMTAASHRRAMTLDELNAVAARRAPFFAEVADLDLDATTSTFDLVTAIRASQT